MPARKRLLPIVIAALLLVAASRAFRLDATVTEVTVDEVWSVWQSLGTPLQIIQWTPYDWPPGYYLALGGWRTLVGLHPVALRWLSLLAFTLGAALLYRAAERLRGDGVIAMLAYAAFGYLIFMSTELRGYILLLALYPLALWLTLRCFTQPKWRRTLPAAILLALTMAAMVYISMTSIPALAALTLFTLIVYRGRVWRWWLPGGLAILLALPELIQKSAIAMTRTSAVATIVLKPFFAALAEMFSLWTGNAVALWAALVLLAALLLILRARRRVAAALIVWVLLPIALYASNGVLGFFNVRYAWWVMVGLALLLGVGLVRLPTLGRRAAALAFAVLALLPIPLDHYQIPQPPLGVNFDWLSQHLQPSDVLLIDPACDCGAPEVYDYYTRVYFPQGLTYVTAPGSYRRIWYITGAHGATASVADAVAQGRRASIFVGPPGGLFRLYEAPPDTAGSLYPNGMRFHGLELLGQNSLPVYHEGDTLSLRLWWSVDTPPPLDYSIGLFIVNADGTIILQQDGPPAVSNAPTATSQWQPGQLYSEEHNFQLPYPLASGVYHLKLAVYWYGDGARLTAPGADADGLLPLLDFTIAAWPH